MTQPASPQGGEHRSLSLSEAVQLIATIAGAGALFGALLFGIGYIGVKQRDTMLGLITTTTYSDYVRAGGVFVPRSVHAIVEFLMSSESVPFWIALGIVLLGIFAVGASRAFPASEAVLWQVEEYVAKFREPILFLVYAVGIGTLFLLFPRMLAPLHSVNTSLLTSVLRSDSTILTLSDSVAIVEQYEAAGDIYVLLHRPNNGRDLLVRYGEYCVWIALVAYGALLLRRWRRISLAGADGRPGSGGYWLTASDWLIRPFFLALLLVLFATLPAVYGVLGMPRDFLCIENVESSGDTMQAIGSGRLLADLSAEVGQVIVYQWKAGGKYSLSFADRAKLSRVSGIACPDANLLAVTPSMTTTDSAVQQPSTSSETLFQGPAKP